jgi:hypothetical protein
MIIISSDEKEYLAALDNTFGFTYSSNRESFMTMDGDEYNLSDGDYIVIKNDNVSVWSSLEAIQEHFGVI